MKTSIIYTIIGLLAINSLCAQVKIGDDPQNLDPSSILELQSANRVLVITRVTDAQMNAISPLNGAMVYNTDDECLNYYNGAEWINICEALDDSFTVSTRDDYLSQLYSNTLDSTVVVSVTDNGDGTMNYNFEVGEINGRNIQDFSIEGRDIANRTIGGEKIGSRSVDPLRIFNNGDDLARQLILWNGNAGPDGEWQRIPETDLQLSENQDLADVVANGSSAGNSIITDVSNPSGPLDVVNLQSLDAAITASELLDDDKDDENELMTGSSIAGGVLSITDAGGDQNINLISGDLNNDIVAGPDGALFFEETLTSLTDNLNGTLTYTDEDGTPTTFDAKITTAVDNADGTFTITDDFGTQVDIGTNETVTTLVDGNDGTFTYTSEDGTPTIFDAKITTAVDNADGTFTITDDFGTQVDINTNETVTTLVDGNDGTFTYTSEDATPTNFDAKITTAVDNADGTFTITDDFGTQVDINTNETVTTLVDGNDGTFTYTSEDGTPTTFDAKIGTVTDNGNGTFTILDDFGGLINIDTNENQTITGGTGISVIPSGSDFLVEVNALQGDVTGPINATVIGTGVIDNSNIVAGAAIEGTKINPDFGNQIVETSGDYLYNGTSIVPPDFVFEKYFEGYSKLRDDYQFKSLEEIESFIRKNNHLPGIRSAYEIIENGKYGLVESSLNHLEKIEELFLHTIEQEKKIESLQSDNQKLTEEVDALKAEMKEIKALLLKKSQN